MSLSQEIVDSIIARNNINANEKIYDTLFGLASEKIGMRKVELAQNMFATGNYEDEDDYYEEDDSVVEYEDDDEYEEDVPEEEYEQ
jgi:hypothetical protein